MPGISSIICNVCNVQIGECTCPDQDARLKGIAFDPANKNVMMKWCMRCDRHFARCSCNDPDFKLICAGQEVTVPEQGFRTLAGGRITPDLKKR